MYPPYCCALLRDVCGRFWLEQRQSRSRYAAGCLTCFGGHREPGESALACLCRELHEELGWAPPADACLPAVTLQVSGRLIAWFYRIQVPPRCRRLEPGRTLSRVPAAQLDRVAISAWHRPVLTAFLQGERRVDL
jgi:8-oxo-dGTP pyrophosphatase MutT (NUDIX family)